MIITNGRMTSGKYIKRTIIVEKAYMYILIELVNIKS